MIHDDMPLAAAFTPHDHDTPLWTSRSPIDFELDLLRAKAREQFDGASATRHLALVIVEIPPLSVLERRRP